ncbi:MAG: hypothetical protein JW751_01610 [Polyangiaceae bacterium]|nr:hypothetical protein [Polyangiaceae bacterium]
MKPTLAFAASATASERSDRLARARWHHRGLLLGVGAVAVVSGVAGCQKKQQDRATSAGAGAGGVVSVTGGAAGVPGGSGGTVAGGAAGARGGAESSAGGGAGVMGGTGGGGGAGAGGRAGAGAGGGVGGGLAGAGGAAGIGGRAEEAGTAGFYAGGHGGDGGSAGRGANAGSDAAGPGGAGGEDPGFVEPPLPDPSEIELHGPCDPSEVTGGFSVVVDEADGYAIFDGSVDDGVDPATVPEVLSDDGGCRLLRRPRLVCDPTCAPGETCSLDEECVAMPLAQPLGTVSVSGLVGGVLSLDPVQPGNRYFDTALENPPYAPGDLIRVMTTTGYLGESQLFGFGVEPLVVRTRTLVFAEDRPVTVRWEAATGDVARIALDVNVDQHGATPVRLVCEVADTGELTLDAGVVNALLDAGVSGFPNGRMMRRTADSLAGPDGCVQFWVYSPVTLAVRVTGHIPCDDQSDCPPAMTCNLALNQCE